MTPRTYFRGLYCDPKEMSEYKFKNNMLDMILCQAGKQRSRVTKHACLHVLPCHALDQHHAVMLLLTKESMLDNENNRSNVTAMKKTAPGDRVINHRRRNGD